MQGSDDTSASTPGGHFRRIFVGRQGVRAGWRLLLFLVLMGVMLGATWPLRRLDHLLLRGFPAVSQAIDVGVRFAAALAAAVLMGSLEYRSLIDYGLPFRRMLGKHFWTGALWGFLMISLIIAIMAAAHAYSPGRSAQAPLEIVKYGVLWAVAFLILGLQCEFLYRGYMQFTLTTGVGFWPAAAVTSVAYAVMTESHWGQFGWYLLMAFFLCMALRRTGNLWFGIGWYVGFSWGLFFVYSVPDMAGVYYTGHLLNASVANRDWGYILTMIVIAAGIVPLAKAYPEVNYAAAAPAPAAGQAEPDKSALAEQPSSTEIGEQIHAAVVIPDATRDGLLRRIFVGAQDTRAGWRMLIFAVLVGLMIAVSGPLQRRIADRLPEGFSPWDPILVFAPQVAILLIAASLMGHFEHRSLADYGLPFRRMLGKQFWTGALWGFAMFSLVIVMLAVVHNYLFGTVALSPLNAVRYGFQWAVACFIQACFIESCYRGYMQFTLTSGLGFWPAAAITCLLDAVASKGHWGDIGFYVLMAFFLSVALRHTGNLWFGIGWNTAYLWSWNFFYSLPNHGVRGTGHLMNSRMSFNWMNLLSVIVIYAAIVLLAKMYPEVMYAAATTPPATGEAKSESDESALAAL